MINVSVILMGLLIEHCGALTHNLFTEDFKDLDKGIWDRCVPALICRWP